MNPQPGRIVADIGNSRMKWAILGPEGRPVQTVAMPIDDPSSWRATLAEWGVGPESRWAIGSVNPAAATTLEVLLQGAGVHSIGWFRSAADVPLRSTLATPNRAGADRALAVLAAIKLGPKAQPGLVISCGTAITIERISGSGIWEGGAIATGLGLSARALARETAQLPLVIPQAAPHPWGDETESALAAGVFWGVVGALRELIRKQDDPGDSPRWKIWCGGDAELLAPFIEPKPIRADLVLLGLGIAGFGVNPGSITS